MRIAVLLASYQGARFLPAQLASLVAQTHGDWVLFWRDDGSDDGSAALLRAFGGVECPAPGRLGPAAGFLHLLRCALGDAACAGFAFCDQDDVWLEDKLARAVAALDAAGAGPALYCARWIATDAALRPLGEAPARPRPPGFPAALAENIATGCTLVMNRAAAELVAGSTVPPGSLHDWWSYIVVAASGGRIIADPAKVLLYRQHAGNAVGAPPGRLGRARAALRRGPGPFMRLMRAHVAALRAQPQLVAAPNRPVLERIDAALRGPPWRRLGLGLRRQTRLETALLRLWLVLG